MAIQEGDSSILADLTRGPSSRISSACSLAEVFDSINHEPFDYSIGRHGKRQDVCGYSLTMGKIAATVSLPTRADDVRTLQRMTTARRGADTPGCRFGRIRDC